MSELTGEIERRADLGIQIKVAHFQATAQQDSDHDPGLVIFKFGSPIWQVNLEDGNTVPYLTFLIRTKVCEP